jgi:hypothetical protein
MHGEYVGLVENINRLTEEREDIIAAAKQAVVRLNDQLDDVASFWKEVGMAQKEGKPAQLTDNLIYTPKGGFSLEKPKGLIDQELLDLLTVDYESEKSVFEFALEVGKEIKADTEKMDIFGDEMEEKFGPAVPKVQKAIIREIVSKFLSKITINSEQVSPQDIKDIVTKAIDKVAA